MIIICHVQINTKVECSKRLVIIKFITQKVCEKNLGKLFSSKNYRIIRPNNEINILKLLNRVYNVINRTVNWYRESTLLYFFYYYISYIVIPMT